MESFGDEAKLVEALNRDRNDDVLIIAVHGAIKKPGTFDAGGRNLRAFLDRIEAKPLPRGASLFFLVCDMGDRERSPMDPGDEPWIAIARKKLHPEGGTAIAATANIRTAWWINLWGRRIGDVGVTGLYGIAGPLAGIVSRDLRASAHHQNQRPILSYSQPYEFRPGVRVYDRATDRVTYYIWEIDPNGNDSFRAIPEDRETGVRRQEP